MLCESQGLDSQIVYFKILKGIQVALISILQLPYPKNIAWCLKVTLEFSGFMDMEKRNRELCKAM